MSFVFIFSLTYQTYQSCQQEFATKFCRLPSALTWPPFRWCARSVASKLHPPPRQTFGQRAGRRKPKDWLAPRPPATELRHRCTPPRLALHCDCKISSRWRIVWRDRSGVAVLRDAQRSTPASNAASVTEYGENAGQSAQAIPARRWYGSGRTVKVLLATRPRALLRSTLTVPPAP